MIRRDTSAMPVAGTPKIRAALTLFDDSLDLLKRHLPLAAADTNTVSAPLPSLLEQCEQYVAQIQSRRGPRLLVVMPGLPQLDPAWWQSRVVGLDCFRLPPGAADLPMPLELDGNTRTEVLSAAVQALAADRTRMGRELLLLAAPEEVADIGLSFDDQLALVAHPWTAFADGTASSDTLDVLCENTSALLDRYPNLPILHADSNRETGELRNIGLATLERLALKRCWRLVEHEPEPEDRPDNGFDHDLRDLVPSYARLCKQLGYDPAPARTSRCQSILENVQVTAQVSGFLKRVSMFGFSDDIIRPRHLSALAARLDAVLQNGTADDFSDKFDAMSNSLPWYEAVILHLLAAAHFTATGVRIHALGLLGEALGRIPLGAREAPGLRLMAASLYLDLNAGRVAMETVLADLSSPGILSDTGRKALEKVIGAQGVEKPGEHGHALLLAYLAANPPLPDTRKRLMVEIGTTRETVPGQGSTRQLAEFCAEQGFDFITVDMDPRNSRNANRLFRKLGLPFNAVTSKGEDWLAMQTGPIDFVFLDAYDFDHGNHSEIRQSRYERYLGARIDDAACHQMHLDCAEALLGCLSPDGVICFDDTWVDDAGAWTAKGQTAMPFLLANGFNVIEARNRAALLGRT